MDPAPELITYLFIANRLGQNPQWVKTVSLVDVVVACEGKAFCRAGLSLLDPAPDERMIDLSLVDVFPQNVSQILLFVLPFVCMYHNINIVGPGT